MVLPRPSRKISAVDVDVLDVEALCDDEYGLGSKEDCEIEQQEG